MKVIRCWHGTSLPMLLLVLMLMSANWLPAQTDSAAAAPARATPAGGAWIDIMSFAASHGAWVDFDILTGTGHILRNQDLVRFKLDFPVYALGTGELLAVAAPRIRGQTLELPLDAARALERWFAGRDEDRAAQFTVAAILIDPGHGGKDPGAIGEFGSGSGHFRILEKDVVLTVALDLFGRLKQRWPDKTIMITRDDDSFPSLEERVAMANNVKLGVNEAIIYVSIHANASFNRNASGFEVWYLNPEYRRTVVDDKKTAGMDSSVIPILNAMLEEEYTTESIFLAKAILDNLAASIGAVSPNRDIRAEEWFVVRNARMPSVLVEVGFVTNEAEARLLSQPTHLKKVGDGIYNGIVDFVGYFETRKGRSAP
jgi:N-acetylmuramoyl-L-alanine amidase